MELNHLKYFYYVAREGGFTKAARYLRIAQPSISKTVKHLETSLGKKLFERSGRTVRLTKVGNDVYRKCEIIFGRIEEIQTMNKSGQQNPVRGALDIVASEPIATHVVPDILKSLLNNHPGIYPGIVSTTASHAVNLLTSEKKDFALLFYVPELPDNLEVKARFSIRFHLVVASDKRNSKTVCSSFIGSREVDDTGNSSYPTLVKLRRHYPEAEIKISTNSISAHRLMVLSGLGVSILPEFLVKKDINKKRLSCLLTDEAFHFDLKLVARRNTPISRASEAFINELHRRYEFVHLK